MKKNLLRSKKKAKECAYRRKMFSHTCLITQYKEIFYKNTYVTKIKFYVTKIKNYYVTKIKLKMLYCKT